jgi:hypothetical protein
MRLREEEPMRLRGLAIGRPYGEIVYGDEQVEGYSRIKTSAWAM